MSLLVHKVFSHNAFALGAEQLAALQGRARMAFGLSTASSLARGFDELYDTVRAQYPYEYVFKNEVVNKIFLARHDVRRSTVLSEMRVGRNRVDLLVVNGTTTAYEIKSDYDSLARLPEQLAAYSEAFEKVYIVCSPARINGAQRMAPSQVGIIEMLPTGRLRMIRRASSNINVMRHEAMFRCLRKAEYEEILSRTCAPLPEFPSMLARRESFKLFQSLEIAKAQSEFVRVIKRRGISHLDPLVSEKVPYAMRHAYFQARPALRERLMSHFSH